jgi:dipeptidyl aminopeptidase/acylaminoacyl peptidase
MDDSGAPLGIHVNTDAYSAVWFDDRMKALQAEADKRFPGRVVRLSCQRCREPDATVLAHAWSDRDPGQFWVYRASDRSWLKVGDSRPDVDPRRMATQDFDRFKARDGHEVPVWLTLPVQPKGSPKPPAVVLVHGGPWVRGGYWGWDPMPQFLASRGYAVIEPEFRGSTGFGEKHFRAGWKQWGRAMQDDVSDALDWARKQGHVDGTRACIMGASYGGYAALMGPIKDPGLYRCSIAWVAVSDPVLLFDWSRESDMNDSTIRFDLPRMLGDPKADAEMLKSASPLQRASELKVPLLLAFGSDDRRVPLKHGTQMRESLIKAGRPPEWVVYAGEGHGGWAVKNRVDFAERVERFLQANLR